MEILNLKDNEDLSFWGVIRTSSTKQLVLGDETKEYDVYKIPVDRLAYNLSNGRMYMEVKKFESEEDIKLEDLRKENIDRYNEEIENLIWSTNEERNGGTKVDIKKFGQLEAGVVLDDGTVIDGNRRFTCIRKLHREFPDDDRFKYFKAALVKVDGLEITRELLKKYELKVQFGADEKLGYNTINMYMSIYDLVVKSKTFDFTTVADLVGKKTNEITKIINTCRLVDEFLEYVGKSGEYVLAEKYNIYWPLEPFGQYLKKNENNMSELEIVKRKSIFFDYLLTLDVELMTQNLRDGLIKKIFTKPDETDLLIEKHNEIIGNKIHNIIESTDDAETFIDEIKTLRSSSNAREDEEVYRDLVNKLTSKTQVDVPIRECKKALESLERLNIKPLLNSDNEIAKKKLEEIYEKIEKIIQVANEIKMEINEHE
jgi:hypothetical protein